MARPPLPDAPGRRPRPLAVGWLCAWDGRPGIPPWRSDDISTALGVPPPAKDTRHTALGDAAWALAIYDHITGGEEKL